MRVRQSRNSDKTKFPAPRSRGAGNTRALFISPDALGEKKQPQNTEDQRGPEETPVPST